MSVVVTEVGRFKLLEKETLLEGLERNGYEVEYQCRMGYCGSCRTSLVKGEVEYTVEPLAYVNPGEILPCCCRPKDESKLIVEVTNIATKEVA